LVALHGRLHLVLINSTSVSDYGLASLVVFIVGTHGLCHLVSVDAAHGILSAIFASAI
jgi:hypothetical protein